MKSIISPLNIPLTLFLFFLNPFLMVTPGETDEPKEYINADSIMAFADNLFHHGYHYIAVMEYERFIYFYPKHPYTPKAQYNIACSMKSAGDYTNALERFNLLTKEYQGTTPGIEALFQKAEVFYLMRDYQSALKQYAKFISYYPNHQLADKAKNYILKIEKQSPQRSQRTQR